MVIEDLLKLKLTNKRLFLQSILLLQSPGVKFTPAFTK